MHSELTSLRPLVESLSSLGATCFLVGGAVRDYLLFGGKAKLKDLDIEVHGISFDELKAALEKKTTVLDVGKRFGILKTPFLGSDWSLPRSDSVGRRPEVSVDPGMGIQQALVRRDLTINAIALNLNLYFKNKKLKKCLVFPLGALCDLRNKIARPVDKKTFVEDPLRFFRVMQFIARFNLEPAREMNFVARTMLLEFENKASIFYLSKERVSSEFEKLLLAKYSSKGLIWLKKTGRLAEVFPELIGHGCDGYFSKLLSSLDVASVFKEPESRIFAKLITLSFFMKDAAPRFFARFCFDQKIVTRALRIASIMQKFEVKNASKLYFKFLAYELRAFSLAEFLLMLKICKKISNSDFKIGWRMAREASVLRYSERALVSGGDVDFVEKKEMIGAVLANFYKLQLIFGFQEKAPLLAIKDLALAGLQ